MMFQTNFYEQIPKRVQFRTTTKLQGGQTMTGPVGDTLADIIQLYNDTELIDFVSDQNGALTVKITDNFDRRYPGNGANYASVNHISMYPGNGTFQIGRHNREYSNDGFNKITDINFEFRKIIPAPSPIFFAVMCNYNWETTNNMPPELLEPAFWKKYSERKIEWEFTLPIVLDAATNDDTFQIQAPGSLMIMGMRYSGGADFLVDLRSTSNLDGPALSTYPIRIDLVANCDALSPFTNNKSNGFIYSGGYYCRSGDSLNIGVQNLNPGFPLNELLTLWGYAVESGRFQ